MATTPAQLAAILERLAPLPVTARSMFGEYALYLDGRIPAFVTDGVLGLKITDYADERLTPDLRGPIYPGSKDYWRIPASLLDDEDWIREAITETTALVPPPKPRRPGGSRSAAGRASGDPGRER
ncbi:MAG TPA: TfoX/Sxy family protein [Microbacteriaceae bacterium]|nr:TfoX/Sxy family protein [Microbacteriaceae bacterium]